MVNPVDFTPVTDNTLLPFGERIELSESGRSEAVSIRPIFPGGLPADSGSLRGQEFGGRLVDLSVIASGRAVRLTSDPNDPYIDYRPQSRDIRYGHNGSWSFDTEDPESGFYLDLNEERGSVVMTWRNVGLQSNPEPGQFSTMQLEMVNHGGAVEYIARYADMNFPSTYTMSATPAYDPAFGLGSFLPKIHGPADLFDTLVGNTGVVGVYQYRTFRGDLVADDLVAPDIGGTLGDDLINGTLMADSISGGAGNDTINGFWSANRLYGDAGNDSLIGGSRDDVLHGGEGDDTLDGTSGRNVLHGDAGDDVLIPGQQSSHVLGGDGNDFVDATGFVEGGPAGHFAHGQAGNDRLAGSPLEDTLAGGDDADTIWGGGSDDQLNGGAGDDSVIGGAGHDSVFGGDGDDTLGGGAHNDRLFAGSGDDFIWGGLGDDQITGGAGADRFYTSGFRQDRSRIVDYDAAEGDLLIFAADNTTAEDIVLRPSGRDIDVIQTYGGVGPDKTLFTLSRHADLDTVVLRLFSEGALEVVTLDVLAF